MHDEYFFHLLDGEVVHSMSVHNEHIESVWMHLSTKSVIAFHNDETVIWDA